MAAYFGSLLGTVDPVLQGAIDDVTDYFSDNIGAVILGVIAISLVLWLIAMFFRATGAKKKGV